MLVCTTMKALSGFKIVVLFIALFSLAQASSATPSCESLFPILSTSTQQYSVQAVTSAGLVGFYNPTTGKEESHTNVIAEVIGTGGQSLGWISFGEAAMRGLKIQRPYTFDNLPDGVLKDLIESKGLIVYPTQRAAFAAPKLVERAMALAALKPIVAIAVDPSAPPKYSIGNQVSAGLRFFKDPATGENSGGTHSVFELLNAEGLVIGWINNVEAGLLGLKFNGADTFEDLAPGILQALIEVNGLKVYPDANTALRSQRK